MHRPKTWTRGLVLLTAALALLAVLALPGVAAAKSKDRDSDGMADRWERKHQVRSAKADPDDDGLHNKSEYRAHTDPRDYDTDSDRSEDGDEDPDRDRVDNGTEQDARTHPRKRDSDRDGRGDGREDPDRDRLRNAGESLTEHDAGDPDTDGDGIKDGDEVAGTVVEIAEDGLVTIELARSGSISGYAGPFTDFGCEGEYDGSEEPREDGLDEKGDADELEREREVSGYDGDSLEDGEEPDSGEEGLDDEYLDDDEEGADEEGADDDDDLDPAADDGADENICSLDDLEVGALVHEAELKLTADGLLFVKIEIVH
jgi:hypothetical protein